MVVINPKLRDHEALKARIKELEGENAELRKQADTSLAEKDLMETKHKKVIYDINEVFGIRAPRPINV